MQWRCGDLIVVNGQASWVTGRYSSGLVLKIFRSSVRGKDIPCAKVMWCDGHVTEEIVTKMEPYYEVILHEAR